MEGGFNAPQPVVAEVTNHSDAPMFGVAVAPQQKRTYIELGDRQYVVGDVSIRDMHYLTGDVYLLEQLAPGQTHIFPSWGSQWGASADGAAVRLPVTTEFTDAAGVRWRRHNRGRPRRL